MSAYLQTKRVEICVRVTETLSFKLNLEIVGMAVASAALKHSVQSDPRSANLHLLPAPGDS
jgi:hypothetical protein